MGLCPRLTARWTGHAMPRRSCVGLLAMWPSSPTRCVVHGCWWEWVAHLCSKPLGLALSVSAPAQVAEAKGKADEARLQAQAALDKANQTRARVESSNKELRELISHVKAFLSRECQRAGGADCPCLALRGSAPAPHLHHAAPTPHRTAWSPHCMWAVPSTAPP